MATTCLLLLLNATISLLKVLAVSLTVAVIVVPFQSGSAQVVETSTEIQLPFVNINNNFSKDDDNGSSINLNKQNDINRNHTQTTTINTTEEDRRFRRRLKSSSLPEFPVPIGNVTAVLGRDTRLICTVDHLGQYQVAWLKEETKTIISIDTNIIITNYRIFLIPDEEERKWVLHIKDVQESDRGFYQCQVNTNPMRSTSGYLEVVVPPTIVESQTSQVAEVAEHSNVSIQCRANGHPRPSISWRREDGIPIRLNGNSNLNENSEPPSAQIIAESVQQFPVSHPLGTQTNSGPQTVIPHLNDIKSDRLSFYNVDRSMGGIYVCSANNGIPTQAIKRIPLHVKFAPKTSVSNKYISVSLGDQLEVDCLIEAYPKANSYWSKTSPPPQQLPQAHRLQKVKWSHQQHMTTADAEVRGNSRALSIEKKQAEIEQESDFTNSSSSMLSNGQGNLQQHKKFISKSNHQIPLLNQYDEHPHNRIQIRQVNHHLVNENNELTSNSPLQRTPTSVIANSHYSSMISNPDPKAYVTVKQSTINLYTFKLKMTIARMQADDYGQYYCISTNSLGTSESLVIVTKADKIERSRSPYVTSDYQSQSEINYQQSGQKLQDPQLISNRQNSLGNRVIYDTNYLQAIKTRQNNVISSSKLQQKLKLRLLIFNPKEYSDRNLGFRLEPYALLIIIFTVAVECLITIHL